MLTGLLEDPSVIVLLWPMTAKEAHLLNNGFKWSKSPGYLAPISTAFASLVKSAEVAQRTSSERVTVLVLLKK